HAAGHPGVSLEREKFLPRPGIPQLHLGVIRSAGQVFAVRAKGHAPYRAGVSLKRKKFVSRPGIPHLDVTWVRPPSGKSATTAHQAVAVRTEGHTDYRAAVSLESEQFPTHPGIPYLHRVVVRRSAARQELSVRAEGDAVAGVLEDVEFLAGLHIPHL